jgi:BarA-like signal transduction histidine kinase
LYNNTTAATVSITVVENLPLEGNYTATFTAQTAGDLLILSVDKAGFDGELNLTAL